jgi:hypothetical protein
MLHDVKELPVYAQPCKVFSTQEAMSVLFSSELKKSSICTKVPFSVEINAVFVVDENKLASPKDVLCDDMGVWSWGGSSKRWISVDEEGFVTFLKKDQADEKDESCYHVWKRYYFLKSSPDVRRMIIILEGKVTCVSVLSYALRFPVWVKTIGLVVGIDCMLCCMCYLA